MTTQPTFTVTTRPAPADRARLNALVLSVPKPAPTMERKAS